MTDYSENSGFGLTNASLTTMADNRSDYDSEKQILYPDIRQPVYMVVIFSLAYGVVFLFALFGNIIVIVVVYRNRRMHTLTNFFIVNLAVADILVAVFCIPITLLDSLYNGWRYGAIMCKVTPYLQSVSVCASVNTLAAIAADRYLAICFTLEHKMTWKIAKIIVCLIWLIAFTIMIPSAVYHRHVEVDTGLQVFYLCMQDWPYQDGNRYFFLVIFISCYIIPLTLIICCYLMIAVRVWNRNAPGIFRYSSVIQKSKFKVIKMLVVVVALFAMSWLPLYLMFMIIYFNPPGQGSALQETFMNVLIPIAQWLGHSNSGMNPVIYCFFSTSIRKRTVALLSCSQTPETRRHQSRYSSTRYVSVDYTNGQITLRLKRNAAARAHQLYCESTFYD